MEMLANRQLGQFTLVYLQHYCGLWYAESHEEHGRHRGWIIDGFSVSWMGSGTTVGCLDASMIDGYNRIGVHYWTLEHSRIAPLLSSSSFSSCAIDRSQDKATKRTSSNTNNRVWIEYAAWERGVGPPARALSGLLSPSSPTNPEIGLIANALKKPRERQNQQPHVFYWLRSSSCPVSPPDVCRRLQVSRVQIDEEVGQFSCIYTETIDLLYDSTKPTSLVRCMGRRR